MTEEKKPKTLFEVIRERIVPINAVIVLAGFIIAGLDFLAPRAPYLKWLGIALGSVVLLMMFLELVFPVKFNAWIKEPAKGLPALLSKMRMGYPSSIRSPAWQAFGALAIVVFTLGQASAAKASEGGLLASQFPSIASLQNTMLGMREDLNDIKEQLKTVKKETSSDPRKELVNLGIQWNEAGLEQAVENQDIKAVGLFSQSQFQPQKRIGFILGRAIESKNENLIASMLDMKWDTIYLQPMSISFYSDTQNKSNSVGCEYLVSVYSDFRHKISDNSKKLMKSACGSPKTISSMLQQNEQLKKWAATQGSEFWIHWTKDVDKFVEFIK